MRRIIVSSYERDVHADAVLWGLERMGHSGLLWQPHLFPARQALSIGFEPGEPVRHWIDGEGAIELGETATVWNRRSRPPQLSADVDERDRDFARSESEQHLAGFLATFAPGALWVNPPAADRLDTNKPAQLALAAELGFRIPPTLISNSPRRIRDFFERHGGDVVYKSYRPESWTDGEAGAFVNNTAAVTAEDMENESALAMCPGIFQARVPKAFELRVTVMGRSFFGVRIEAPALDWRSDKAGMRLERFEPGGEIRAMCKAYMDKAGLVFACFDLIVSPSSETHFLEVNPMGQFLWQEERIPDLPLLDAMCAFLASGERDFEWDESRASLRFDDYRQWRIGGGARAAALEAAGADA